MAGWGDSPFSKRFGALLSAGQLRYLGYMPREELLTIISAARGLLYPSIYEGFGLPPLEAMGCGVMPLVSDASSLPEVVGELGLQLPAQDVSAWTDGMARLAADLASGVWDRAHGALRRQPEYVGALCLVTALP